MAEWIVEVKDGKFPIGKWTKLVRCKDCKHRDDEFVCKYDSWDPFERSRPSYEDDWFWHYCPNCGAKMDEVEK